MPLAMVAPRRAVLAAVAFVASPASRARLPTNATLGTHVFTCSPPLAIHTISTASPCASSPCQTSATDPASVPAPGPHPVAKSLADTSFQWCSTIADPRDLAISHVYSLSPLARASSATHPATGYGGLQRWGCKGQQADLAEALRRSSRHSSQARSYLRQPDPPAIPTTGGAPHLPFAFTPSISFCPRLHVQMSPHNATDGGLGAAASTVPTVVPCALASTSSSSSSTSVADVAAPIVASTGSSVSDSSKGSGADATGGEDASSFQLSGFNKDTMLELLRHVPLPVVVITAAAPAPATDNGEGKSPADANESGRDVDLVVRGMTCSSFSSVSMDPPLVSVCIKRGSHFLDFLKVTSTFGVHLLSQENKQHANEFARPRPDMSTEEFGSKVGDWELVHVTDFSNPISPTVQTSAQWKGSFKGGSFAATAAAAVQGYDGQGGDSNPDADERVVPVMKDTMAALVCRTHAVLPAGDHCLVLGEVLAVSTGDTSSPLLYMNRGYHQIGGSI